MMDAVDGSEVGSFPVGQAFRDRFQNPYAVIHRADIHTSMLEATQGSESDSCGNLDQSSQRDTRQSKV
jgi:hypothetical protein